MTNVGEVRVGFHRACLAGADGEGTHAETGDDVCCTIAITFEVGAGYRRRTTLVATDDRHRDVEGVRPCEAGAETRREDGEPRVDVVAIEQLHHLALARSRDEFVPTAYSAAVNDPRVASVDVHRNHAATSGRLELAPIADGQARTSPGRALGFLFIPFYNLYWMFQVLPGWASDFNAYCARHGIRARASMGPLLAAVLIIPLPAIVSGFGAVHTSGIEGAFFMSLVSTVLVTIHVIAQTWLILHVCACVNAVADHQTMPQQPPYR